METLFIDRKSIKLSVENSRLMVHYPSQGRNSLPLTNLKTIIASSGLELDTTVLRMLNKHHINLVVTNSKDSNAIAITTPYRHGHAERRLRQYQMALNPIACLIFSRKLMRLKIRGQLKTVRHWLYLRPDQRYVLTQAVRGIELSCLQLKNAHTLSQLRGIEGQAAACYFSAFAVNTAANLCFTGRNKRPPKDPINVVLSLTYTMLQHEAINALSAAGLDPLLGFYHQLDYGRESLACDMVEPLRIEADQFVLSLFANSLLNQTQFSQDERGACIMNKTGRGYFYAKYYDHMPIWREKLRKLAFMYVRLLSKYTSSHLG